MQTQIPTIVSLESIAITFCGVVLLWLVRVTIDNRDNLRDIRAALFGVNMENGLHSTVSEMREKMDRIERTVLRCQTMHGIDDNQTPTD